MLKDMLPGKLILANGDVFCGWRPKWQTQKIFGEVVFNTGMTGYEESFTDPSYSGQILTLTYPILGNYGVSDGKSWESYKIHLNGIICQNVYNTPSHHSKQYTLLQWLEKEQVPILTGVDTRALTKVIRNHGVINGALVFNDEIPNSFPDVMSEDLVAKVSCKEAKIYGSGSHKIILVDCGLKQNILQSLLKFNVTVKVVPFDYDYTNEDYAGVFLSNGPGDPKTCATTISILKKALQVNKPIYGICLGSQLMALAIGADTYKLIFGHRGQNQPCLELNTNKCYLTSQNHGYAINEKTLPDGWLINYRNINDDTVAGICHESRPFKSVQFHPESAPGPHDTLYFFKEFIDLVERASK